MRVALITPRFLMNPLNSRDRFSYSSNSANPWYYGSLAGMVQLGISPFREGRVPCERPDGRTAEMEALLKAHFSQDHSCSQFETVKEAPDRACLLQSMKTHSRLWVSKPFYTQNGWAANWQCRLLVLKTYQQRDEQVYLQP